MERLEKAGGRKPAAPEFRNSFGHGPNLEYPQRAPFGFLYGKSRPVRLDAINGGFTL